jgi:hypothetical protein
VNRDDVKVLLAAGVIAFVLVCGAAAMAHGREPELPPGVSCADVREKIAELGRFKAVAAAIERGATWHQIREALKCLR